MTVRTRFAPSPTGFLHIGGARTALYNWLYARKHGGAFVLRVEDTDAARSTGESLDIILDGLRWLGLDWDEGPAAGGEHGPYYQSERRGIYDRYLEKLQTAGLVYEDEGAVRFRVPDKEITFHDEVCADVTVNLKEQGSRRYDAETKKEVEANPDIVVRRPDGSFIFHFVNVVDDIEMRISHVIRGEDHLPNTPKHLALFEAFGVEPPVYAHIPLNLNPNGSKMSKRDEGALIHEYVEKGFLPDGVNNYMALLGWSPKDDSEIFDTATLRERFDLAGITPSNSKFDYEKCRWVNGEHLRRMSADALAVRVAPFLEIAGIDKEDERILPALELARERAQLLADIPPVIAPVFSNGIDWEEDAVAKIDGRDGIADLLTALAKGLASVEDWSGEGIKAGITETAEGLGLKMGKLMQPCRIAVTGSTAGADLVPMMELIGREECVRRVEGLAAKLT